MEEVYVHSHAITSDFCREVWPVVREAALLAPPAMSCRPRAAPASYAHEALTYRSRMPPVTLPAAIPPQPNEAFDSWVERLAAVNHTTVPAVLDAAGFGPWSYRGGPHIYGVHHPTDGMRRLEQMCRLEPGTLDRHLLDQFDGTAFNLAAALPTDPRSLRRLWQTAWVTASRSRICVECLWERGDYSMDARWRLGFAFTCPIHDRVLRDRCPGCRKPLRQSKGPIPYSRAVPTPDRCQNLTSGRGSLLCGYDLGDLAPGPPVSPEQTEAQWVVLHMLDQDKGEAFGEVLTCTEWFATLRLVISLVGRTSTPAEFTGLLDTHTADLVAQHCAARDATIKRAGSWTNPPKNASLGSALLTRALDLMADTNHDHLALLIARSVQQDAHAGRTTWLPTTWHQPASWRQLWAPHYDSLNRIRRHWMPPIPNQQPTRLPGGLPPAQMARFGDLLTGTAPYKARVFAAVAVARASGSPSWRQAWRDLGYPDDQRRRSWIEAPLRRLQAAGLERQLADAAFNVAETADQWCRDDYGARRTELAGFTDIDWHTWKEWLDTNDITGLRQQRQTRYAAMWWWQHHTGGDYRLSPAYDQARLDGLTKEQIGAAMRRFPPFGG